MIWIFFRHFQEFIHTFFSLFLLFYTDFLLKVCRFERQFLSKKDISIQLFTSDDKIISFFILAYLLLIGTGASKYVKF